MNFFFIYKSGIISNMSQNFQYACTNISLWCDGQKAIHLYQTIILL